MNNIYESADESKLFLRYLLVITACLIEQNPLQVSDLNIAFMFCRIQPAPEFSLIRQQYIFKKSHLFIKKSFIHTTFATPLQNPYT